MIHAMHVHPHDIRDEGAAVVVGNIVDRAHIKTIIAEATTLEERHPYPRGVLPHNPVRGVFVSHATLEVPFGGETFRDLAVRPVLSPAAADGQDYLGSLRDAAAGSGAEVIPWLKALNGAFAGGIDRVCVRTISGEPVPTWLCPTRPETAEFVLRLVRSVQERYQSSALLLDRLRYPDWSGANVNPERMLTCFCDVCRKRMQLDGIDLTLLKRSLLSLRAVSPGGLQEAHNRANLEMIERWLAFRQARITELAGLISADLRDYNQVTGVNTAFWLNLWPPSFARFMGQDYHALGLLCEGAKHFPYHRLGGGADLAGLVDALVPERVAREPMFQTVLGLLGMPYRLTYEQFKADGLPVTFVAEETSKAKSAFGADKGIFTGVQIWDTPVSEIDRAYQAAKLGKADGVFFYCYGWAALAALDAVGGIVAPFF